MNPFMRWLDHSRFACNFCGFTGECPREYGCALGADGRRSDWAARPELREGSVEYVAPPEYMVRPAMSPALFFCVDVSPRAVETGATTSAIEAIARTLDAVPDPDRTLVGVCTFDAAAHFYHIPYNTLGGSSRGGSQGGQPRMLVVPDVDEPYAPVPDGLAVPLGPCRDAIDGVLKQLPKMFCDPKENGRRGAPCGAAAVKACVEALKPIGGRVLAFIASLPTGGMGALKPRGPVNQGSTAGGGGGGGVNNESDKDAAKYLAPGDKVRSPHTGPHTTVLAR
jgi:protein transport protein SEC24